MKNLNNRIAFLLLMVAGMFGVQKTIADTAIPLSVGNYLVTSTSETTGAIKNNDGGNLGSIQKDATATFTLTNASAQDMVLTFLTGNDNNSSPQVTVTMNDGTQDFFTETVDIENTGGWTPITKHVFDVGEVPAGTVTLKFAFTNTSSYVCNLGSIGVYNKNDYLATLDAMPGNITLSKGTYQTARIEGGGNVGYMSNGASAYYPDLFVSNAGKATLNIGLVHYGDGTLNVKITDLSTGVVEVNENLAITSAVCHGLETPTAFELGNITAGYKAMKFTVSTSASYLANYKALSLSIDSWTPVAIDLRSGQLGTSGSNLQKYLVIDAEENYSYSDEEPGSYNALLMANSWNGSQHGYVNFKAKVPVKTGIYKITLGTCQFGTGTGYVKNADESSTLNIVDANGQVQTSFNQNTGACYHNNTTSNVISVWYEAENDETISIVCGDYTPYFAIEKVNAVPELKYSVTYAKGDGVEGTVPSVEYVTSGNSVTLPVNRTLYKDGYTLTGWNDGVTTYEPGDSYTPASDVTLNAVFTANTYTFDQTVSEMTVRWDFQRGNGCPLISMEGAGATAILVQQANVNGNTIDMKLDIDAISGKFANGSWTDWAQVNEGTTFSFPSVEGTTVKAFSMNEPKNNSDVKSSVDGNEYSSYASNVATYATTPINSSSTLTVKGGTYYRYIDVTYPAAAITGITELTVDGTAVGSEVIAAINNGDAYTATLSGNSYTTVPVVEATFDTSAQATGVASGTGTSRTYTINDGNKDYTLVVEGIHVYDTTGGEESVNIKMNEGTVSDNVWTNGVYTMTTTGIGSSGGADFKFDANTDAPYTISVPADVVVKQFIIKNFHANYSGGNGQLKTVTSTGATTYIPTKHNCVYSGETTAPNRTYEGPAYDLVVTIEGHTAGTPIVFTMLKSAQPMGWIQLTTVTADPGTAPVKTGKSVAVVNNHAAVSVTFDREIANDVTATINETSVTAEGGATTLVFPVWGLSYSTNYTLTIPANAVEDVYGNKNSSAIEIAVNVPAKPAVSPAAYDYVVGDADELLAALDAIQSTNQNDKNASRKTVFLKNGDYDLGSSNETVRWVRSHNLSLIGESRDGVVIHGISDGISNPVLNLRYWQGFYLQDLTVRNDKNYGLENKNGVAVAIYGGDKTIMKNVRMLSNQDTQVTGDRAYFEDCKIHGTVDFICGGGDNFYYHTDLVLENRGGNVIVAPSTNTSTKWGYVFHECTIKGVDDAAAATNAGSYNLGRPWQNSPRTAFINTKMEVVPSAVGWGDMSTIPAWFVEYNSKDGNNNDVDLSSRKTHYQYTVNEQVIEGYSTYERVVTATLTAEQAAKFTLQNVLGGTDSWLPTDYTYETAAPVVSASGSTISWNAVDDARCYVIFKDGKYLANQTGTSYNITSAGVYTVRAANEMGGLGNISNAFVSKNVSAAGWATYCSPYALDLEHATGLTDAYIVTGASGDNLVATSVKGGTIPANTGILIKAPAGTVTIPVVASSSTDVSGNKFQGVTTSGFVLEKESGYVLMTSPLVAFYKNENDFTLTANTAYLPANIATGGARSLRIAFDDITGINQIDNGQVTIDSSLPVKRVVNGKLVIEKNGQLFNANGQHVK